MKLRACVLVLFCMFGNFLSAIAYKAGVVDSSNNAVSEIMPLVHEAGEKNVDVLVLASDIANSEDSYDEIVKALSQAAKKAGLYLVAHLSENTICQNKREPVRSNVVFDREGAIIAVYRKPTTGIANCTITSGSVSFETDFGVSLGLMMEEDLVLKRSVLNNVVVAGNWHSKIPFLSTPQFISTWAYTTNANVLSKEGIFAGQAGLKSVSGKLFIADLKNVADEESVSVPPVVTPSSIKEFSAEDLSQYIFSPLDVEASTRGLRETVCHNKFCCEFDIKTRYTGSKQDASYGLAAFDGIRHYNGRHRIGTQNCVVIACAGAHTDSCTIGSTNNRTNMVFDKLTVSANFTTENSIQYPVIVSNEILPADKFNILTKSDKKTKKVTVEATGSSLLAFGIFGRDFENDYDNALENKDGDSGIYEYIFTEDLQELFDYLWIRLRILLFIVSLYVLEMM